MASYLKYVIPFILFFSLNLIATKAQDDLQYQYRVCTQDKFTPNSTYQSNLKTLFSSLASKASNNVLFFNNTITGTNPSDTVYGQFMCRGDIPSDLCNQCVGNATQLLSTNVNCSLSKRAIVYYEQCIVRYSNTSFFSTVTMRAGYVLGSPINMTNQESFKRLVYVTLNKTADDASNSPTGAKKFAVRVTDIDIFQKVYCLAQCTPDLSPRDCRSCLDSLINIDLPDCCAGRQGGRVLYPNCLIRFELYPFYRSPESSPTPTQTPAQSRENKNRSRTIISVVVPIVILASLFTFCYYLLRRRARTSRKSLLRENFGEESSILEGLQFDLAAIKVATNNFSHENKIGKGGFGEVYKGILPDGRHIAVKRLSTSSRQGSVEFKNEILLIAKLQHRNLVTFIGFCLEEQEKILMYEYVPNRSLDYFLFDTQQQQKLSWYERRKIIEGTALGILYLHEYSRLKIIHRDLKPSNVLLDENMNPKISDFGLARIVDIDQNRAETDRIVGTYGYMSPEYAMLGQFSEKSDVFSFGIIILEIITGKKNANSYESHPADDGLMSYVWRHWKNQTPLSILDPNMKENYFQTEVIRCIQIGLLCVQQNPNVRLSMAEVVSYLNNHSLELPSPQEPAFFLHGIDQKIIMQQGSSSSTSVISSTPFSVNEMSTSDFYPR